MWKRFSWAHGMQLGSAEGPAVSFAAHIWFTYPCLQTLILDMTLNVLWMFFFSPVSWESKAYAILMQKEKPQKVYQKRQHKLANRYMNQMIWFKFHADEGGWCGPPFVHGWRHLPVAWRTLAGYTLWLWITSRGSLQLLPFCDSVVCVALTFCQYSAEGCRS